jgi:hypothetical protein
MLGKRSPITKKRPLIIRHGLFSFLSFVSGSTDNGCELLGRHLLRAPGLDSIQRMPQGFCSILRRNQRLLSRP